MIRPTELRSIKDGEIDLAFRRWERPRVVVGTRMRTMVGLVEVTSVEQVEVDDLTEEDARRAGSPSLAALVKALEPKADRPAWRVGLRHAGEDPRALLRDAVPDKAEVADHRRAARAPRPGVVVRRVDPPDPRPDRPQPRAPGPRPGGQGGPRDGGLQEGRAQAQGARADRVAGDRLPALAARRGRRRQAARSRGASDHRDPKARRSPAPSARPRPARCARRGW